MDEPENSGSTFIYGPLKARQIRLLAVLPKTRSKGESSANTILTRYDIDQCPPYLALSYCWGDSRKADRIDVNGMRLGITHNLSRAFPYLRQIQAREGVLHWWIDAVCINQLDLDERRRQVLMMRDIFSSAAGAIIWLGEPASSQENPLACVDALSDEYSAESRATGPTSLNGVPQPSQFLQFLLHRYFTRLWMVQENSAAARVVLYLGNLRQSREKVVQACRSAFESNIRGQQGPQTSLLSTVTRRALSLLEPKAQPLLHLMSHFRGLECTDPRDKIYALLSICTDEQKAALGAHGYNESIESLYTLTAYSLITWTKSLSVLSCVQHSRTPPRPDTLLPSWVPDWRLPWKAAQLDPQFSNAKAGPSFIATKGIPALASLSSCGTKLHVKGITVDSISSIYHLTHDDLTKMSTSLLSLLSSILSFLSHTTKSLHDPYPKTRESHLNALLRTISADSLKLKSDLDVIISRSPKPTFSATNAMMNLELYFTPRQTKRWADLNITSTTSYLPWVGGTGHVATIFNGSRLVDESFDFTVQAINHIKNLLIGRVMFMTQRGYLGLGPDGSREGDRVGALIGGDVLFVLRRGRAKENKYRLVGECYLHGFMDGAVISQDGGREEYEDVTLV